MRPTLSVRARRAAWIDRNAYPVFGAICVAVFVAGLLLDALRRWVCR